MAAVPAKPIMRTSFEHHRKLARFEAMIAGFGAEFIRTVEDLCASSRQNPAMQLEILRLINLLESRGWDFSDLLSPATLGDLEGFKGGNQGNNAHLFPEGLIDSLLNREKAPVEVSSRRTREALDVLSDDFILEQLRRNLSVRDATLLMAVLPPSRARQCLLALKPRQRQKIVSRFNKDFADMVPEDAVSVANTVVARQELRRGRRFFRDIN
jgi:hypothetical protein